MMLWYASSVSTRPGLSNSYRFADDLLSPEKCEVMRRGTADMMAHVLDYKTLGTVQVIGSSGVFIMREPHFSRQSHVTYPTTAGS
jgi:hypothetical protein